MTSSKNIRFFTSAAAATLIGLSTFSGAHAQAPQRTPSAPTTGSTFQCEDGGKMVLTFADTGGSISAMIWLRGMTYQLPTLPPEPGPARIVWSDGDHSLTWSPGVQLMWMSSDTHLMCGRGGHKH